MKAVNKASGFLEKDAPRGDGERAEKLEVYYHLHSIGEGCGPPRFFATHLQRLAERLLDTNKKQHLCGGFKSRLAHQQNPRKYHTFGGVTYFSVLFKA